MEILIPDFYIDESNPKNKYRNPVHFYLFL